MKKVFIVSQVEWSKEEEPQVYVALSDTKADFSPSRRYRKFPESSVGFTAIPITSLEDLKNLPNKISDSLERAFSGEQSSYPGATIFNMSLSEFNSLDIGKGDRVVLEFKINRQ